MPARQWISPARSSRNSASNRQVGDGCHAVRVGAPLSGRAARQSGTADRTRRPLDCVGSRDLGFVAAVQYLGLLASTRAGIVGHIEIADDVHITGATVVSHTIREAGTYSSGSPLEPYTSWLRNAVRMRQLDDMARRLKRLEQKLKKISEGGER